MDIYRERDLFISIRILTYIDEKQNFKTLNMSLLRIKYDHYCFTRMALALDNLRRLVCHLTKKPNQTNIFNFSWLNVLLIQIHYNNLSHIDQYLHVFHNKMFINSNQVINSYALLHAYSDGELVWMLRHKKMSLKIISTYHLHDCLYITTKSVTSYCTFIFRHICLNITMYFNVSK